MPAPAEFDRLRVILVAARNPLNIGAAARAMSNFGFLHLRVVNPFQVAFREARSAVGASELLARAQEFSSVAEAVADCALVVGTTAAAQRELRHPLNRLEAAAPIIREHLVSGLVGLLFGSEKRGLSNADLSYCHWLMRIPTREEHLSMNLGQAVAVSLYELARDLNSEPADHSNAARQTREPANAPVDDLERITSVLLETLHISGYLNPLAGAATEEKIRRLVRRLNLTERDAEIWLGILRQIMWKLRNGG